VIAVENGNIELIKVLLECKIDVKVFAYLCVIFVHVWLQDGLLYAINEEFVEAVELLLEWEENVHEPGASYVIFLLTLGFRFLFCLFLELGESRKLLFFVYFRFNPSGFSVPQK
jgi:hypothetical protein